MIRSRKRIKSTHQLKEEQIIFLLEDIEKNLEEYKKAIPLRDNQITEAKKYFRPLKKVTTQSCKKINNLKSILKIFKIGIKSTYNNRNKKNFQDKKLLSSSITTKKNIKKYITKN